MRLPRFAVVCALHVLNPRSVDVYVRVAHGGDAHLITRYLGHGWFDLARDAPSTRRVNRNQDRMLESLLLGKAAPALLVGVLGGRAAEAGLEAAWRAASLTSAFLRRP
jgi:hypothetical protein